MRRDDDWEDERAADLHDRALRHGEMHRDVSGEWVDNWWFPFEGVERDVEQRRDGQGEDAGASPVDGVAG